MEKDFGITKENCKSSKRNCSKYSQSFKSVYPTFQLDEKTHQLVEVGFRDVQKEIESHKTCALDIMLDKFLDKNEEFKQQYDVVESDEIVEYKSSVLDLSELGEALEVAEIYREKYGLPLSTEPKDVFAYVKQLELENKAKIKQLEEKGKDINENA